MANNSMSATVSNTSNAYRPDSTNPYLNTHRASGMPNIGADTGSMPVTSTNVSVWCNGQRVGVVKSFKVSESRTNTKLQELGTEGVIQIVPGNTKGGNITIDRIALYNSSLFNALGLTSNGKFQQNDGSSSWYRTGNQADETYHRPTSSNSYTFSNPFKTLKDQRVPLEIMTKTQLSGSMDAWYVETYIDCWLSSFGKTISATEITITENATIEYSDVMATYTTDSGFKVDNDNYNS